MFSIDVQKSIFLKPSLVVGNTKMWYNKTEVATKEELEKVKGLIDVGAKIVYSTVVPDNVDAVPVPVDYDYVIITTAIYDYDINGEAGTNVCYQSNTTVNKGGTAYIPVSYGNRETASYGFINARALASEISFDSTISYAWSIKVTIVAYKYTQ